MILETKKFIFKKLQVFLEESLPNRLDMEKKYDSIVIVSHGKLDLPHWNLREKDTALIDLSLSSEDIFKRFNDTTRNEIRRTYDNKNLTFVMNSRFDESYELYNQFEKSQGRKPVAKSEMSSFTTSLALYKDDPLYGFYITESFPYARVRSIFSKRLSIEDKETIKIISNCGRRLMWEICQDLKKRGFKSLDLASVNMENPHTKNIAKFKMSFGGDVIREYTYIYESPSFKNLNSLRRFLRFF